jgi:hypothetical protein
MRLMAPGSGKIRSPRLSGMPLLYHQSWALFMYLTLQYPIADVRVFLRGDGACLASPNWPTPETDRQFVRYFGPVRRRLLGGSGVKWMGDELYYCDARRALRLPSLGSNTYPEWGNRQRILRRLFLHKPALVRVETAFAITPHPERPLVGEEVIQRFAELLTLPSRVPDVEKTERAGPSSELALVLQGRRLAHLFLRATVPMREPSSTPVEEWAVRDGEPMFLVEYGRDELNSLPGYIKRLPENQTHGFLISYTTMRFHGRTVVMWFLEASPAGKSKVVRRQLRLCLLRLHLEYQVLGLILNTVYDRLEFESCPNGQDRLEAYLDAATRRLFKTTRFGINQQALYAATAAYRELISEDRRALLMDKLKHICEQVRRRVDRITQDVTPASAIEAVTIKREHGRVTYQVEHIDNVYIGETIVDRPTTITQSGTGNILNVADFMSNVTNQVNNNIQQSSASDDAKALVKQLADEINAISTKIDLKLTERMGSDLQTLSNEMKQSEPRKAWYELSLKGLKEAAETIGEIASPILTTVGKLMPLLLGS